MKTIETKGAPEAIGPYTQGKVVAPYVFTSGQIALTPEGEFLGGTIEEQTERVLENVRAIVEAAGSSLDQVIKTTVYLNDISEFEAMNAVYEKAFGSHAPARTTVEVSKLPKNAKVEIEAVAQLPS